MLLGVTAAIWHSWLAPLLLRRRLAAARATLDAEKAYTSPDPLCDEKAAAATPDLDFTDVATPNNSPKAGDPGLSRSTLNLPDDGSTLAASLAKLAKDSSGDLVKPKPAYCSDKRIRLSASAPERDLPWWFF